MPIQCHSPPMVTSLHVFSGTQMRFIFGRSPLLATDFIKNLNLQLFVYMQDHFSLHMENQLLFPSIQQFTYGIQENQSSPVAQLCLSISMTSFWGSLLIID